jgi:catechol 2,3-dioxygenase-like lactoylglutathione lyase family enzyme/GNAT superfamily N-acetyltransferase
LEEKLTGTEEWRQAEPTDATAIHELTRAAYAKWVPLIGREPLPMTADYTQSVLKHRFDLIHINGKLAALIETIVQADHLLIENVAVSPSFQKRGLGGKLLAHAEKLAAASGFSEIKLYTNRVFAENIQLYSKLGYHVDREEAFMGGFLVHMSKPVNHPDDPAGVRNIMARPQVSHVLETSLYVSDLETSKQFYARIFGFSLMFENERMCAMEVPGSAVLLLFLHNASMHPGHVPGGIVPPHDGTGALHVCFAIPMASLDSWVSHLAAESVGIESTVTWPYGGTSLYFRDPDGHSVEIATPGLWKNY